MSTTKIIVKKMFLSQYGSVSLRCCGWQCSNWEEKGKEKKNKIIIDRIGSVLL